jgi:hypothetical protein
MIQNAAPEGGVRPLTAKEVVSALRAHHPSPEWAVFTELRAGTGYGKRSEQRIDLWAIDCYPSKQCRRLAYEVKVSRQDFLNELKDPLKRRGALLLSNEFWFVGPEGFAKPEEIPIECGLLVIRRKVSDERGSWSQGWRPIRKSKYECKSVIDAPVRESILPTWRFVASLARRIAREEKANAEVVA